MKILKPGKVEQRKFVCPKCGCEFTAMPDDCEFAIPHTIYCPQKGCDEVTEWYKGEPYEEPTRDKKYDTEHLAEILLKTYELQRPVTTQQIAELLIANGVTFREG